MEELERYNQEYKNRLDEVGALGDIPGDLAIEVMKSWQFCNFREALIALRIDIYCRNIMILKEKFPS